MPRYNKSIKIKNNELFKYKTKKINIYFQEACIF